jgi:RNA polymerase sigma factor (sigma-70 family)
MHPAERYYLTRINGSPDRRLRDKIVRDNLKLVRLIASEWIVKAPHLQMDDLIQEGSIGLTKAVETFEPEYKGKPCRFSVWASIKIKGELMHYLRDNRSIVRVSRSWSDAYPKILRVEEEWSKRGIRPSDSDYLQSLGRTRAEVNQIKAAMANSVALSADQEDFEQLASAPTESDSLEAEYRRAYLRQELDRVKGLLHQILTAEQRKILKIREQQQLVIASVDHTHFNPWQGQVEQMSLFFVEAQPVGQRKSFKRQRSRGTVEQLSLMLFDAILP